MKDREIESGRISSWEEELDLALGHSPVPWVVRCYDTLASTMDCARALISEVTENRAGLVMAREQTKGRGRQGRAWIQSEEGFYATYAFASRLEAHKLVPISLVTGLVLTEILDKFGCQLGLKWPNDLLSRNGGKLCGILTELVSQNGLNYILVGIGVNLSGEPAGLSRAVSLFSLCGVKITQVELAGLLSSELFSAFKKLEGGGFGQFREAWLSKAYNLSGNITVHVGAEFIEGRFLSITESASLLVEVNGEVREISSGEVLNVSGV